MGNLPVIFGNGNIPNLTGNFRTLGQGQGSRSVHVEFLCPERLLL